MAGVQEQDNDRAGEGHGRGAYEPKYSTRRRVSMEDRIATVKSRIGTAGHTQPGGCRTVRFSGSEREWTVEENKILRQEAAVGGRTWTNRAAEKLNRSVGDCRAQFRLLKSQDRQWLTAKEAGGKKREGHHNDGAKSSGNRPPASRTTREVLPHKRLPAPGYPLPPSPAELRRKQEEYLNELRVAEGKQPIDYHHADNLTVGTEVRDGKIPPTTTDADWDEWR